jgi:hypothetical protein
MHIEHSRRCRKIGDGLKVPNDNGLIDHFTELGTERKIIKPKLRVRSTLI